MRLQRSKRYVGLCLAAACLAWAGPVATVAAAVPIDTLSSGDRTALAAATPGAREFVAVPGAEGDLLGGERDLLLEQTAGRGAVRASIEDGLLTLRTDAGTRGRLVLQWDGTDASAVLAPDGLGGVDLTDGGAVSGLSFDVRRATLGAEILVELHGATGVFARGKLRLPPAEDRTFILPFSRFATVGSGDPTEVGAVVATISLAADAELVLAGVSGTLSISVADATATKTDSLLVDNDADTVADPGDTLRYEVEITSTGSETATDVEFADTLDPNTTLVPGSIQTTPLALDDAYDAQGNVGITVPAGSGVLVNDFDVDGVGPALTVSNSDVLSTGGGAVSVAGDGSFSYTPPAGLVGTDTFTYEVDDGEGFFDTATVTITVGTPIWFIDNGAGAGDGSLASPFNSLSAFDTVNGTGGTNPGPGAGIFLYGTGSDYAGPVTLEDEQVLIGEGATASIETILGIVLPPFSLPLPATGGLRPNLTSASFGIVLAADNTVRGLDVGDTTDPGISGVAVGSLTIDEVAIDGTGRIVDLAGGPLAVDFDSVATSGGPGTAVNLNANTGTINLGAVDITTTDQIGIFASGSGTLNVSSGTIATGEASCVDIDNTVLGIVLTSCTSQNGMAPGIDLRSTTGSFHVNGDGTAMPFGNGSGGTISGKTGANGSSNGVGVFLDDVTGVELRNMQLNDMSNFAIRGTDVIGFAFDDGTINGSNGNDAAGDEGAIRLTNLLGVATLSNAEIVGGFEDNLLIENSSGTLTSLTIEDSTLRNNNAGAGNNGLRFVATGTAQIDLIDIARGTFSFIAATGVQIQVDGSATIADATIQDTIFTSNNIAMDLGQAGNGALTFLLDANDTTDHSSHAISVFSASGSTGGSLTGTIRGNTIGQSGLVDSGSAVGNGIRVNVNGQCDGTFLIENNDLFEISNGRGLELVGRLGTGGADFTVLGNELFTPTGFGATAFPLEGLFVESNTSNTVCADISGNTMVGGVDFGFGEDRAYALEENGTSTFNLEGTEADAMTQITNNNTGTPVGADATIAIVAPGTCATP